MSPTDPVTFVVVAVTLFGIVLAAQGLPLARALSIDPAAALRQD